MYFIHLYCQIPNEFTLHNKSGDQNISNPAHFREAKLSGIGQRKATRFAKDIFIETYVPQRTAQLNLANYNVVKLAIPGDTGITAGKVIEFNLMSIKPTTNKRELDRFYSGKYLVTAVRHIIQPQGIYQTIIELAKDSSPTSYPTISNDNAEFKKAINT